MAGRYPAVGEQYLNVTWFQSSPSRMAGRYVALVAMVLQDGGVSILAQPNGRALPGSVEPLAINDSFQSSPSRMAGRYHL
ncbi:hypothetical protein SAMN05421881_100531 [Nitrosomonas halophila]|uniref:Uncharacterized protein n=1 Tax=Nitrosomonas halophila TaxID=44576 RepID=A0A1H3DJ31_9PROT|nr:hypothetical protein SAMN05421881_100531 [Nitrosomonas halophila]